MFQARREQTSGVRLPFILQRERCPSSLPLPSLSTQILDLTAKLLCTCHVLLHSFFPDPSSLHFSLSVSHRFYENSSPRMRLIKLENEIMRRSPSALNPLQSRSRVYFISLATHIFNHKSCTLVDPLDVEECF